MNIEKIKQLSDRVKKADVKWAGIHIRHEDWDGINEYVISVQELVTELDKAPKVLTDEQCRDIASTWYVRSDVPEFLEDSTWFAKFFMHLRDNGYFAPASKLTDEECRSLSSKWIHSYLESKGDRFALQRGVSSVISPVLAEFLMHLRDTGHLAPAVGLTIDVDELAQIIRTVDGSNSLGAGALAEAILSAVQAKKTTRQSNHEKSHKILCVRSEQLRWYFL